MTGQLETRKNMPSSCDKRSSNRRWCHPFIGFLEGAGFWISHVVIVIGVIAVLLLEWFDMRPDGVWEVVAAPATMAFGVAVLFAFAGWIARCSR